MKIKKLDGDWLILTKEDLNKLFNEASEHYKFKPLECSFFDFDKFQIFLENIFQNNGFNPSELKVKDIYENSNKIKFRG